MTKMRLELLRQQMKESQLNAEQVCRGFLPKSALEIISMPNGIDEVIGSWCKSVQVKIATTRR
jgi:hypothetical protein